MKLESSFVVYLVVIVGLGFGSVANGHDDASGKVVYVASSADVAERRFEVDREMAPVKSWADLDAHLQEAFDSPLDALGEEALTTFVDSLVFGKGGLASFNQQVLGQNLTPTQIHGVLALFGFQHLTSKFQEARVESETDAELQRQEDVPLGVRRGYCSGKATCTENSTHWCYVPGCQEP